MHGTTSALVVAAAIAAASLPVAASAQSTGGPSSVNPYAGYTPPAMPPAHVLDRAGISPEELQTYARVRHDLMQDPNVASLLRQPEDLRTQALDRYLDRNRTGMDAEEFIRIHRTVENNPQLRAYVESGPSSGAAQSGSSTTGAAPLASPK